MSNLIFVVNTDLPVDEHFADSMAAYAIGAGSKFDIWKRRFYHEMHINSPATNPWMRELVTVKADCDWVKWINYAPWPTEGYGWNGRYNYANLKTLKTLNGTQLCPLSILPFCHPAKMSVAFFFRRELHQLLFSTLLARAKQFCTEYPNSREGRYHQITSIHYDNHTPQ